MLQETNNIRKTSERVYAASIDLLNAAGKFKPGNRALAIVNYTERPRPKGIYNFSAEVNERVEACMRFRSKSFVRRCASYSNETIYFSLKMVLETLFILRLYISFNFGHESW